MMGGGEGNHHLNISISKSSLYLSIEPNVK